MRGTHHHHLALVGIFPQRRIATHGKHIGWLVGHKHHHKIGRILDCLIFFVCQLIHMLAHARQMAAERFGTRCLVGGIHIFHIGGERSFRIYHQSLIIGHKKHHIGAQTPAVFAFQHTAVGLARHLRFVVHPLLQPRHVENLLQHHFAPVALHLAVATQSEGEFLRLLPYVAVHVGEVFDLLLQCGGAAHLLGLVAVDGALQAFQVLTQRFHNLAHTHIVLLTHGTTLLREQLLSHILKHQTRVGFQPSLLLAQNSHLLLHSRTIFARTQEHHHQHAHGSQRQH